ncbi:MAG: hypothetical protein M3Q30_26185 [Actinomycetota bacterium]|nr:hypothetical protein [Actinomycetota bacterium]
MSVVCVTMVASVAFDLAGRHGSGAPKGRGGSGGSERAVLAALAKTGATGHFDLAYALTEAPAVSRSSQPRAVSVSGAGTVHTDPFSMTISAHVSGVSSFVVADLSIWVDGKRSAYAFGLHPTATGGAGSPLSANEDLVEGALGPRVGAVAMMGLASPTGLLDLAQPAVTGAAESGTGTVNNFLVTDYKVSIDVARLGLAAGTTPEERTVISHALALLHQQGYRNTTVTVAIDAAGLIRRATSVTHFADGGSVTLQRTLSNLGPIPARTTAYSPSP